ncbi:cytochrome P450 [Salsipaludibacter albus]|uniref:cytochrome P450 n=1 Tax=Salsipaludibacter albus TaxID=2849650 RepID=UPI001EE47B59|nr:cytochrome P450 [Salsipaludibacter albus]
MDVGWRWIDGTDGTIDTLTTQFHGLVRDSARMVAFAAMRRRGGLVGELFDRASLVDPYPMYERIRTTGRVLHTPLGHMTSHHDLCDTIARRPSTTTGTAVRRDTIGGASRVQRWLFSQPDRTGLVDPLGPQSMIGVDGTDHARLRRLVSRAFTPASIEALRPRLGSIARDLAADLPTDEPFDLMDRFANVLPVLAICEVLGIPEADHRRFKAWGSALAVDLDAAALAHRQRAGTRALRELGDYLADLVAARRRDPGDDLVSALVAVEEDGDQLTDRELLATCMLLLLAGFETTVNLLGNGTAAMLAAPDQLDWLRGDLGRLPGAVEELLRFDAPVQMVVRIVGEPMDVPVVDEHGGDVGTLPAGAPVVLQLAGANRDPAVFDDPDHLDLSRPNARRHLAFASGPHYCLGAALARLEGEVGFAALLERLGTMRAAGTPTRRSSFVLRGFQTLPVTGDG